MKRVAIVGAGIVGTTLAWHLVRAGHRVDMFEIGADTPYPHAPQFENEVLYANAFAAVAQPIPPQLPKGLRGVAQSGDYPNGLDSERSMCVGGQATRWWGITPRMLPASFRPKSLHGRGTDWPIHYEDLEPYYGQAELYLGISGSNDDNPFAAPRSQPYPLPPFEFSATDEVLAARFRAQGLQVHTTPQARTREAFDARPGCRNFGTCTTCPIGARYSPNHHLAQALRTGLLTLHTRALVRRIVLDRNRARAVLYHPDHGTTAKEHAADVVIAAAGGLESARLLMLSGIGNASGQLGRNLAFHHVWRGAMQFKARTMPGRAGPPTMLSHQFVEPAAAAAHGGMTVELPDAVPAVPFDAVAQRPWRNGKEIIEALRPVTHMRSIVFNAESQPGPGKYATLSKKLSDRFGDPFLHVHYELDDFDRATHVTAQRIGERFAQAAGAEAVSMDGVSNYWSAHHHLGTCRMGASARDGVVDPFGAVHDAQGVYVCGGSTFVTSTAFQPTLTMVALAIRTARKIADTLRG